uniref:RNA polymerase sigma factor n=1 Tax=Flavobacterium sp. TaxID=239 RepID=UPI0040490496
MRVINLHQDENNLIRQAKEGNRQAQQSIYQKFSPKMLGVCRQYVKDVQLAEDVMITAFMKVFVNLNNFEFKGSFEGWIRRIMVNESISFLRVQKKTDFLEDTFYQEVGAEVDDSFLSVDDLQFLIDQLPDGYKMVFNLYVIEGYKHHEIAKMLGINEGTSKSQLSQARKTLQLQINALNQSKNESK